MTTILHIKSSSNLQGSVTRKVGAVAAERLQSQKSGAQIIVRDLVSSPVPHISPEFLGAMASNDQAGLALSNQLIDELMASDTLVIEVPMYNFSIPSVLKAWIDHVARQGKTFAYSAAGPEGLAKGKRAILVLGSGGVYSEGPAKTMEHTESYLRILLGFIGITDVEAIYIEGVGMGPDKAAEALEKATQRANALA